ncbi:GIY-YIG nuclease family protein [Bacillus sp. FJAT-50079]|uniref:GIY-YIG nuclease family protein n=1 Tax=Bacillus sp. FJAT-50079 TaxID=2833577 RepID=UPI001BC92172|nr:GIY-YIG nuclease family protein [Bacillus sp. FJAT-50079]MBS4210782.1 GIY-YIG nuclease family protein [Bacillus sp. FJAT-50079]
MAMKTKHFFYVLECNDGSFYGGYTVDLERRLLQHNRGKGAKYTRMKRPVKMIYSEEFADKREAMQAEYSFKQMPRRKKEEFLKKASEWNEDAEEF